MSEAEAGWEVWECISALLRSSHESSRASVRRRRFLGWELESADKTGRDSRRKGFLLLLAFCLAAEGKANSRRYLPGRSMGVCWGTVDQNDLQLLKLGGGILAMPTSSAVQSTLSPSVDGLRQSQSLKRKNELLRISL